MSLLNANKVECVMLEKTKEDDGEGGFSTVWKDALTFHAAIILTDSAKVRKAEKEDLKNVYTVTVSTAVAPKFHDVFRRLSDGQSFRVISDATDNKTPIGAALDMLQFKAEEWMLT